MRGGVAGELLTADALVAAVRAMRAQGWVAVDAYTPFPVHGLEEALDLGRPRQNWVIFPIAIAGAFASFAIQAFVNAWAYPLNTGARPPFAAPAFVPITFEGGVLTAAFAAFFGFFISVGLPRLSHALFDVEGFDRVSVDRFWIAVDARDPRFDADAVARALQALGAVRITRFGEVPT